MIFRLLSLITILLSVAAANVHAQWTTQVIDLRPGWNAVFLEIQPEPRECDIVFSDLPVESSVWGWNRRFSPVEYIQDPGKLIPNHPDWLVYFPRGHRLETQRNLYTLDAGKCYLINLPDTASPRTWTIKGRPKVRTPEWVSGSFNLVGFPVTDTPSPSLTDFFAAASTLANMFRLGSDGHWTRMDIPGSAATLRSGEGFWAFASSASDFVGPLRITLGQRSGLEYGRILQEQPVRIRNDSRTARTITVKLLNSDTPSPGYPPVAGPVVFEYWDNNLSYTRGGWTPLTSPITANLAPGAEWTLRLAVRRQAMPNAGLYQSVLEVRDSPASLRVLIPVSAEGIQGASTVQLSTRGALGLQSPSESPPYFRAGLWVGSVVLANVSRPASLPPDSIEETPAQFQFRLLVHVNAQGKANLLQKVLQMWQEGTYKADPAGSTNQIVDIPGRFVLLTDDALIPQFKGAALRDGQPVARRYSSAAFGFSAPQPMEGSGDFGEESSVFTRSVVLSFDDALNPFLHRYHPDHDNLNERFEINNPLKEGQESFSITRNLRLQFTATDPQALGIPGWGDNQIGGLYQETIKGLHNHDLTVSGVFRLHRASPVTVLNDNL